MKVLENVINCTQDDMQKAKQESFKYEFKHD